MKLDDTETGLAGARRLRRERPTNVHLAFPGEAYQVEVFSPEGDLALRLVSNGKIQPVPAPAP